ncbi:RHS repeat-associated core domain-containing protein [Pseudomonas frederiksbergensis]|uniref:RHS repeat-associated core domain-containing protein n=1 Tax=Pseudomonas frederiksbergensis TaxID=104087 RepID=UPI003CFD8079
MAYLRESADVVESIITRQRHDHAGRLIEQWDPRLFGTALTPNLASIYSLSGDSLKVDSVDVGWRLSLIGVAGEVLQSWDGRGNHWRTDYDDQLRITALEENTQPQIERFAYANALADAGHNLRGQMVEQVDPAGRVTYDSYSLDARVLQETRVFADGEACPSRRTWSPLGAVLSQTDAGEHRQDLRYNIAGQLQQILLQLKTDPQPRTILRDAHYNAAGQIEQQVTANDVLGAWTYDPADGCLLSLKTGNPGQALQQNFEYGYDPMGNVVHIKDLTLATLYFANQRVDNERTFTYDSLYRLTSASGFEAEIPQLQPGLPDLISPIDPGRRYNYLEHYEYDAGNNLKTLRHVRDNNNFTQQMLIDPASNRSVRKEDGAPAPDFGQLFDRNGNLRVLQRGQPLSWNARDQLTRVTLLSHGNGLPDDDETYLYSQDQRVLKCHSTHTPSLTHRDEVRYLPGLEIRRKSNGEHLHVISLPLASGTARCLHWVAGQPAGVEADQVRYSHDDQLGSSSLELDRQGLKISQEIYYPFGGTAWWAARSSIEADYKTLRYSGREMDASGLYFYGARYYAPWLQRWISADPGGDVDGLNLYAMVGNNPVSYIDINGEVRWPKVADINAGIDRIIEAENAEYAQTRQEIATRRVRRQLNKQVTRQIEILGITKRRVRDASQQLAAMGSGSDVALAAARRSMVLVAGKVISYGVGIAVGIGAQSLGVVAPGIGNVVGAGLGFAAKAVTSGLVDYVAERTGLSAPVNLKTKKLTAEKIIKKAEYKQMDPVEYVKAKYQNMNLSSRNSQLKLTKEAAALASSELLKATLAGLPSEAVSAISSGVGVLLGLPEIVDETLGAARGKSDAKMEQFVSNVLGLAGAIESSMADIHEYAGALSVTSIGGIDIQALQEETDTITGVLYSFAKTIGNHRNNRKAAA